MTKLMVWTGLAAVSWLTLTTAGMLLMLWPQPTGGFLTGFAAATGLWIWVTDIRAVTVEATHERKDAAIDGAMTVAMSAQQLEQRIGGEHPEVVLCDQDSDATYRERLA